MSYSIPKKAKILFAAFIVLLILGLTAPLVYAGLNYDSFPTDLYSHIEVRTGLTQITRNITFGILKFLAKGVTEIEEQVQRILTFDVVSLFKELGLVDESSYLLSRRLVAAIFSIFLLIGACTLVVFRSKIHLSEFLVGTLTSLAMIIALPLFISTFNNMKNAGLSDISNIQYTQSEVYYSIGDEVLSASLIDVYRSGSNGSMMYYDTSGNRGYNTVYDLDINEVLNRTNFDKAIEAWQPDLQNNAQRTYANLSVNDKMALIGLDREYDILFEAYRNNYADIQILRSASSIQEEYQQRYSPDASSYNTYTYGEYYDYLQDLVYRKIAARFPTRYNYTTAKEKAIGHTSNFGDFIDCYREELSLLLYNQNRNRVLSASSSGSYLYRDLITEQAYEDMDGLGDMSFDSIEHWLSTFGYPAEYIYRYDYNFLPTLIILLALILSLVFAALKIATVIYDLVFVQIIAGIVIATDQRNSGRAKKTLQELLNSYLIFILCALLIKIFIILSMTVIKSDLSLFIKIILIIGFAKGTIDGPDFIVKLTGADAGVKSGAATVMAINQGVNLTRSATAPVIRATQTAARTGAGAAAGTVNGFVNGSASGAESSLHRGVIGGIGGAVGGAFSGGASGHNSRSIAGAFSSGFNSGNRTGNSFGDWLGGVGFGSSANSSAGDTNSTSSGGSATTGNPSNNGSSHTHSNSSSVNGNASAPSGGPSGGNNASTPSGGSSGGSNHSAPSGGPSGGSYASAPSGGPSGGNNASAPSGSPSGGSYASAPSGSSSSRDNSSAPSGGSSGNGNYSAVFSNGKPIPTKGEKGDPGQKGDQGIQGIQGMQGMRGDRGADGQSEKGNSENNGASSPASGQAFNYSPGSSSSSSSASTAPVPGSAFSGTFADNQRKSENAAPSYSDSQRRSEGSSFVSEQRNAEAQNSFAEIERYKENKTEKKGDK